MNKILHIAYDDKFIERAYKSFEDVYTGQNDVWIYDNKDSYDYIKSDQFHKISRKDLLKLSTFKRLKEYDCVIIHALIPAFIWLILCSSKQIKYAWVGWGYDYYDLIYDDVHEMYLPKTSEIYKNYIDKKKLPVKIFRKLAKAIKGPLLKILKVKVLEKIEIFSPVLKEEHRLIKEKYSIDSMGEYVYWQYSSLEDTVKGFDKERVNGNNILLGNNATYTNNHLDILGLLNQTNRKILMPLSYGDDFYQKEMIEKSSIYFDGDIDFMMDYIPLEDYISKISSCDVVIMNHIRQQALGNIIIMLYLGAKVFLREECPTYRFLKDLGIHFFSIQSLEKNIDLIKQELSEDQIQKNRDILYVYCNKNQSVSNTRNIVSVLKDTNN